MAQLYGRAHNAKDARARHDNTFYLFEAAIKLAAIPSVAAYLDEVDRGGRRVVEVNKALICLASPSLGQWVAILRVLARYFGSRPDAASHPLGQSLAQLETPRKNRPALLALYRRIKNGPDGTPTYDESCSILDIIHSLVQYRNGVFGHGAARFEGFYASEMGPLLFPAANELLAEGTLDLLGPRGSRLVQLVEIRSLVNGRVEVGLRDLIGLQGERAAPLILDRKQADWLSPNRVALIWPGRPLPLRLDPLLAYREGELADEVLFLNRDRNGRQVEYLSYTTGRTERDRSTTEAMARLLSRVAGREILEDQVDALGELSVAEIPSLELFLGPEPQAGRVRGDYEVLAEIGRGGMGVVYLARQLSLGRFVALKMLPADLAGDEVSLARFRREMRVLSRCEHPNIVKVLASGTMPEGDIFYAMEYVPGCDLEQVWQEMTSDKVPDSPSSLGSGSWSRAVISASRKKREQSERRFSAGQPGETKVPLPPMPEITPCPDDVGGYVRRVAALFRDAALALQAVHDQQVIHRDIKPANLMLTPDGSRIVLMDFGLAKGQSHSLSASRSGGLKGTLRYAAPEQLAAASLRVGASADVRGLSVVLWELVTRRQLLSEAADERQLAEQVLQHDVPRLREVNPGLDRDLEAIVARATERRVADRIGSAKLLADYLDLYLRGENLPIRPPSSGEMLGRWVRQHKPLVGSIAASLLVICLTVVIAFFQIALERDSANSARD